MQQQLSVGNILCKWTTYNTIMSKLIWMHTYVYRTPPSILTELICLVFCFQAPSATALQWHGPSHAIAVTTTTQNTQSQSLIFAAPIQGQPSSLTAAEYITPLKAILYMTSWYEHWWGSHVLSLVHSHVLLPYFPCNYGHFALKVLKEWPLDGKLFSFYYRSKVRFAFLFHHVTAQSNGTHDLWTQSVEHRQRLESAWVDRYLWHVKCFAHTSQIETVFPMVG